MVLLLAACARQLAPTPEPAPGPGAVLAPPARISSDAGGAGSARTIADLGAWPFLTPIDAPLTLAPVAPGAPPLDATPEGCGACHPAVYAEWLQTTHAAALRDLQYLAELAKPDQPRWLCLGCHTPTSAQRPERIAPDVGLVGMELVVEPNPDWDPARRDDAIGCPTCHVRRDADGAGVVIAPGDHGRSPHRVRADPDGLRDICVRCHSPGPARLTPTFVCWFETADELAAATGQAGVGGSSPAPGCVDCHMPVTTRPVVAGEAPRPTRRHHWVGGGVPKDYADYARLLDRGWESGLDVQVSPVPSTGAAPGGPAEVRLVNARAGHHLPTADPERHLRVELRVEGPGGSVLARRVERIGQVWDWGDAATARSARRLSDNRLRAGEVRVLRVPTLPDGASAPGAALVVEVLHVRLSADNLAYMRTVVPDAMLAALRPGLAADLARMDALYPTATWIYAGRFPLDGGSPVIETPGALLARSASAATLGVEGLRAWTSIPPP